MNPIRILLLLFLPWTARGTELYHLHPLSENERQELYAVIMRDACRHADQFWREWSVDPRGGFWGSGRSDQMNEGIRAVSAMTLTCGALLKYSDILTPVERTEYTRKAMAAIRYATASHLTGPLKCTDGKPWGNSWQSAMWTADLACGAWLVWDKVDPGLQPDLERVVAFEADRFLAGPPPAGSFNDTKAEENGWDLTCLALAASMFPDHRHAPAWREKAVEYMINTLSAPQDAADTSIVEGRAVRDWFTGANVHPDFTLENHGFFHPGYVGCSCYFLTQSALYFTLARQPVPAAADHHLLDTWKMFQGILLPDGESACPQGMDWELHGLPYLNLFASLATWKRDPLAARLEESYLQYMRAWQVLDRGNLAVAGSTLGFTRHAICAQQAAYAFLAHKIFGPAVPELTARQAAAQVAGVQTRDWTEVVTHRTEDKFASFSWTNRIMGLVMPIGPGHEGNPAFIAPIVNGLVGGFDLNPRGNLKIQLIDHSWRKTTDGFETTGTLRMNGGRLAQLLRVTSVGRQAVVYQDRVTALADLSVTGERGVPLGIENDLVNGGTRRLWYQGGSTLFDWQQPGVSLTVPGSWANVDGRLAIITAAGSGIRYQQAMDYSPGMSVCTDLLYGSFSTKTRRFKAGDEVAHRIVLFFVEVSPRKTATLARSVKVRDQSVGFDLPEGGHAQIPLLQNAPVNPAYLPD